MRSLSVAAAVLLVGCMTQGDPTPSQEADQWALANARETGAAENCIDIHRIRTSHVRSNEVIDFEMNDGRMMRSRLPHGCPGLGFEERFTYHTSLSRLCGVDIITVLHSDGSRGASCGLGNFQPVEIAPR